jgi:hypothetical protein
VSDDLTPCPHCKRSPRVYHGAYGGVYGDSVECDCDDFPQPDDAASFYWHYTSWTEAVRRWNAYAATKR